MPSKKRTRRRDGLFKKQRTNYVVNGKRWHDGAPVNRNTAGAVAKVTESEEWYTRVRDADGKLHEHRLCRDRSAALIMRGDLLRQAALRKAGAIDPHADHNKRPLTEHIEDFRRFLSGKGGCEKHVNQTVAIILAVASECKFRRLQDLSDAKVSDHLVKRREPREDGTRGLSIAASNHHVIAFKSFGNWLWRNKRVAENPFMQLAKLNADTDRRRVRRALPIDELGRLIAAAETSICSFRGTNGSARAALYMTAAFTGLRAQELATLTVDKFDLLSTTPTVRADATNTKNGRTDTLPLHKDLAVRLRTWLASKEADAPATIRIHLKQNVDLVWPGKWFERAADMLRMDLARARGLWLKEAGRDIQEQLRRLRSDVLRYETVQGVVDFHAMRHGFITALARSGVHPKVAQELARHSTIILTMGTYAHVEMTEKSSAINSVPAPPKTA